MKRRKKVEPLEKYFTKRVKRSEGIAAAYGSGEYSQREIGDHLGIHYSTVSRFLRDLK